MGLKLVGSAIGAKAWDSYPQEMWLKDLCGFLSVLSELLSCLLACWNRLEAIVNLLMLIFLQDMVHYQLKEYLKHMG